MAQFSVDILVRDLVRLLGDLIGMHGELGDAMRDKLDAMRRADTDRIAAITSREMVLAHRVIEREGLLRQMMQRLASAPGSADKSSGRIRLAELAESLPEPRRSQVLGLAAGLRERAEQIEQMRVVTTLVTQEMLKHLGEVLAVMTAGEVGGDVYGRTGQRVRGAGSHVFEAVG